MAKKTTSSLEILGMEIRVMGDIRREKSLTVFVVLLIVITY